MEVVSGAAEEFAEGPFSGPGGAENEDRAKRLRVLGNDRIGVHKWDISQKRQIPQVW